MKLLLFLVIAVLFVLITPSAFATPVEIIDSTADGTNKFRIPQSIAVDSAGNVYVAGTHSHNVFKIETPDYCSTSIDPCDITEIINEDGDDLPISPGYEKRLWFTNAIAVDSAGNVYVVGSRSDNAFKITPDGFKTEIINFSDGLEFPSGIAVDSNDNVYVVGQNSHNVFKITPSGDISEIITSTSISTDAEDELKSPRGIAVDSNDNVYVAFSRSDNVLKIDASNDCSTHVEDPPCIVTEIINFNDGLDEPQSIAVDSNDNVYVTGFSSWNAFKITPEGDKTEIINQDSFGDKTLKRPAGIAVDSSFNVYVAFTYNHYVFKITPGGFITVIIDKTGDGLPPPPPHIQRLASPWAIAVDSKDNVYVTGTRVPHTVFKISPDEPSPSILLAKSKKSNCIDCIPPTLGVNINGKNMVSDGFSFNGNYTNVGYLHTPFPLISTEIGVNNTMTMKIYENFGINEISNVRVGLGMKTIGTPIDLAEAIVNIKFIKGMISDIEITDHQFLIQDVEASSEVVKCKESSNAKKCLEVKLTYSYRESPMYNAVAISPVDFHINSWPAYFNDGIKVDGMSLNEPAKVIASGDLYTQLDKWQDTWVDDDNIEYQRNMAGQMVRTTEWSSIQCNDTPLDEIIGGVGRANCHFRALTPLW